MVRTPWILLGDHLPLRKRTSPLHNLGETDHHGA